MSNAISNSLWCYKRFYREEMEKKLANFLTGWSYEDVLPFFKISEDNRDYQIAKNTRFDSRLKTRAPSTLRLERLWSPLPLAITVRKSC